MIRGSAIKRVGRILVSVQGVLSVLPTVGVVLNPLFDILPISSEGKPAFYFLYIIMIATIFLIEVSHLPSSTSRDRAGRKGSSRFLIVMAGIAILSFLGFVAVTEIAKTFHPTFPWVYVLALLAAMCLASVSWLLLKLAIRAESIQEEDSFGQ